MAMCEKCQKAGYEPAKMFVEGDQFVGPCCATPYSRPVAGAQVHVLPNQPQEDVEYGVEVTNKKGVRAFVHYGGLDIAFERTPAQIRNWAEQNGLVDEKKKTA